MRLTKTTIFIALFIIISASFMSQVVDFFQARIGKDGVTAFIKWLLCLVALALFVFVVKNRPNVIKVLMFIVLLVIGLFFVWRMKIPVEQIHLLEYGILGWCAARDLVKGPNKFRGVFGAVAFAIIVGILDEAFQAILPYRYYDRRDIAFNALGGAWGVALFLLRQ